MTQMTEAYQIIREIPAPGIGSADLADRMDITTIRASNILQALYHQKALIRVPIPGSHAIGRGGTAYTYYVDPAVKLF